MADVNVRAPFRDDDGDGLDDDSGLPRAEHEGSMGAGEGGVIAPGSLDALILDLDRDGRDDDSGLTQDELNRALGGFGFNQYSDADGDGVDDRTGLDRQRFQEQENLIRGRTTDRGGAATRAFADTDGDGKDDATGLDRDTYRAVQNRATSMASTARRSAERARGADVAGADRAAAAEAEAQRQADAAAHDREVADYREQYNEYVESGQRRRDLDAGRQPMAPPGTPGAPDYRASGGTSPGAAGGGGAESDRIETGNATVDNIVNNLLGTDQAAAVALAEAERQRREEAWEELYGYMPTPEDLAVAYGERTLHEEAPVVTAEADQGSIDAQRRALEQYEEIYGSGGMTTADRARLAQGEREMARGMRSQREADLAALRARGLGGSGASIASMLAAQQSGADMLADREAGIQERAEKRAIDALSSGADLSGKMRDQSWTENSWNATQMTDWNKRSAEHWRDVDEYNVGARDKSAESMANARQQGFRNRMDVTSGAEGAYQGGSEDVRHAQDAESGAINRIIAGVGTASEEILKNLR